MPAENSLILMLANKLATAVHKLGKQYSSCVKGNYSQAKSLIEVLSLQATT